MEDTLLYYKDTEVFLKEVTSECHLESTTRVTSLLLVESRLVMSPIKVHEQDATPEGIETVASALDAWLDDDQQSSLRRALETWIVQSVLPARLPGVDLPDNIPLKEVQAMLGEKLKTWGEEQ